MISYEPMSKIHAGGQRQNWSSLQIIRKSKKKYYNPDWNFSVLSDKVLGDTSLHYTQELSVALSLVYFSSYSMCFMDLFFKYHYFLSNKLCSKLLLIYNDRGVKSATFGDISVFSVFWCNGSYLSWEASQQNFVFIFLHPMTTPNFLGNKVFFAVPKFNITRKIYC